MNVMALVNPRHILSKKNVARLGCPILGQKPLGSVLSGDKTDGDPALVFRQSETANDLSTNSNSMLFAGRGSEPRRI